MFRLMVFRVSMARWTLCGSSIPTASRTRGGRGPTAITKPGYFQKPMIGLEGTPDGIDMSQIKGLGLLIDLDSQDDAIRSILDISDVQIQEWHNHYDTVDVSAFTLTGEHAQLLETICDARVECELVTD